jgi:hypothetical protein
MPRTTTRLPASWVSSEYPCEWICSPSNCPGIAGSGHRASQWCPLATQTPSYSRTSPVESRTSNTPSSRCRTWDTPVRNLIRSRNPKWST